MPTNPGLTKKPSVTPGKLILIGVLAVVLIVVVVVQIGGGSSTPAADLQPSKRPVAQRSSGRRAAQPRPQRQQTNKPETTARPRKSWPVMTIDKVVAHDPFVLPAPLLPAQTVALHPMNLSDGSTADQLEDEESQFEAAQRRKRELAIQQELEERLSEIGKKGVGMVFLGGGEPVAKIGTQSVRVGDIVDGLRIAEIRTNGSVVVELADDDQ